MELLVVVAIVGILTSFVLVIFASANKDNSKTEQELCQDYGDYTIQNIPAKCLKYFQADSSKSPVTSFSSFDSK